MRLSADSPISVDKLLTVLRVNFCKIDIIFLDKEVFAVGKASRLTRLQEPKRHSSWQNSLPAAEVRRGALTTRMN
jgi:hypothetical protein